MVEKQKPEPAVVKVADLRVTCIKKMDVVIPIVHAGITHLGGENWLLSRADVIKAINSGTYTFHTLVDGKRAEVQVRSGVVNHLDFVQTKADGQWTDNLLALPQCGTP